MRRYAPFLVGLLFIVPALACGAGTPTPKVSSGATSAPAAVSSTSAAPAATAAPKATNTTAAAAPARAKIGDKTDLKNYSLIVHSMEDPTPGGQFFKPKAGFRWIALDVTITAAQNEVAYNPFYAKLKLADNTEVSTTIGGKEPDLQSGKLTAGDSVRGWLTFEIPESAQPAQFIYEIISFGSGGRVTVDLK